MFSMALAFKSHKARSAKPLPDGEAVKRQPQPAKAPGKAKAEKPKEIGGPSGPEPTRYGDWEVNGRCVDF